MSTVTNWLELEREIAAGIKMARRPVAVTCLDAAAGGGNSSPQFRSLASPGG